MTTLQRSMVFQIFLKSAASGRGGNGVLPPLPLLIYDSIPCSAKQIKTLTSLLVCLVLCPASCFFWIPTHSACYQSVRVMEGFVNVICRGPFPPAAAEHMQLDVEVDVVNSVEVVSEDFESILCELDDVMLEDWVETPWRGSQGVGRVASSEFLELDSRFRSIVAEGGDNPSANQNKWALNRLRKFHQHLGQDLSVELVDLSALEAVNLLAIFFEQVTKANGHLYPSGSLMNLLGAFNRVLRRKQEERIMATGIDEPPFTMKTSPLFRRVCVACVLSMRRSRSQGIGTERKQVKVVAKKTEKEILADASMASTHSRGLFRRVGFYCIFRFGMRGGGELHSLTQTDFHFGEDENGKFVQYNERSSKNGKATMSRFQPEHFRGGLKNYEEDLVDCFETYYRHLPPGMTEFFLGIIDNPRTPSWYTRGPMGKNTLSLLVKQIFEENGLDPAEFSNKSGRTTLVTRMGEAGVPPDVGMLVTGHQSEKSYSRYDRSKEAKIRAAQRCATEENLTYVQALAEENQKLKSDMIEGSTESPPKRVKCADDSGTERVSLEMSSLNIESQKMMSFSSVVTGESPVIDVDNGGKIEQKGSGKRAREERKGVEDLGEWDWMSKFDWEGDLKSWDDSRTLIVNPISALLGKLVNCDGLVINFNGDVNFKS